MDRRFSRTLNRGYVVVAAVSAVCLAPATAHAASVISHQISGYNFITSCMTAKVCVAGGYNDKGVGDVVAIRNGIQTHVSTLPGSQGVSGVSCPTATSCVGVADFGGSHIGIVSINSAGIVSKTKRVVLSAGYGLTQISCTSATACVLAGVADLSRPEKLLVATWNGSEVKAHKVTVPKNGTDPTVGGISCWGTTCVVVGYATVHTSATLGVEVSVTNGTTVKTNTADDDSLYSVSCISNSKCYAAGYNTHGGIVDTFTNGALTSTNKTPGSDVFGIACVATSCTVVGDKDATGHTNDVYWGTIYPFSNGVVRAASVVDPADGLNSVARVGSTYTAVGPTQRGNNALVARN